MEGKASVAMAYRALEERPGFLDIRVRFCSIFHCSLFILPFSFLLFFCLLCVMWELDDRVLFWEMADADILLVRCRQRERSLQNGRRNRARQDG